MDADYDVVIVGGGPAGTATALTLRRARPALRIALLERSRYQHGRIGETLPPAARGLLERLGVWSKLEAQGHLPAYGTSAAWGSDEAHDNEFMLSRGGQGWHVDRRGFDRMLADEAARAGVVVRLGQALTGQRREDDGGWTLMLRTEGNPEDGTAGNTNVRGRFVVDATGRRARIARAAGARLVRHDRLVATVGFFTLDASQADAIDSYALVESVEHGWWYSARLPREQLVVACFGDGDDDEHPWLRRPEAWRQALQGARLTAQRVGTADWDGRVIGQAASSQRLDRVMGDDWIAVGDAAATFDPLSSQGIVTALQTGMLAAYALVDRLEGRDDAIAKYQAQHERRYAAYLDAHRLHYARERRWPEHPFWRRRHQTIWLSPQQRLDRVVTSAPAEPVRGLHLPGPALARLTASCDGRPAAEVIRSFKTHPATQACSDARVILALQQLVEDEVLRLR